MGYENITLRKRNVTMIDGYFYMLDENQDAMIVKTDDGTQAYSYPLDTIVGPEIVSMEFDGRNFWTLENPGSDTVRIRSWRFENYVLKLVKNFVMSTTSPTTGHKYSSEAMTVEHYHLRVHGLGVTYNAGTSIIPMYIPKTLQTDIDLSSVDKLKGRTISLGPNKDGRVEDKTAITVTPISHGQETVYDVQLSSSTAYAYKGPTASGLGYDYRERYGDPASFSNNIWLFNNWDGQSSAAGALYKFDTDTGAYRNRFPGGEYKSVKSCTFFDVPNYIFDRDWQDTPANDAFNWPKFNSIAYVRTTNMIFLNPDDFSSSYGSMTMDNIDDQQSRVLSIYDLTMEGVNVYRLQKEATYYGDTKGPWANFSYQLSTLEPFITSISLRANPAILPANGVNTSTITAIVKDQFNLPIAGKLVYFTEDDPAGSITGPNPATTDVDGVATTAYTAGTSAREVKITATAQQGGVETPTD